MEQGPGPAMRAIPRMRASAPPAGRRNLLVQSRKPPHILDRVIEAGAFIMPGKLRDPLADIGIVNPGDEFVRSLSGRLMPAPAGNDLGHPLVPDGGCLSWRPLRTRRQTALA